MTIVRIWLYLISVRFVPRPVPTITRPLHRRIAIFHRPANVQCNPAAAADAAADAAASL